MKKMDKSSHNFKENSKKILQYMGTLLDFQYIGKKHFQHGFSG